LFAFLSVAGNYSPDLQSLKRPQASLGEYL
jgi:hypothetical protein